MKLIYVTKGTSPSLFDEYLKKYHNQIPQQAQKYNQLLMEGLVQNGAEVLTISTRPLNRRMTSQKYFSSKKEREREIDYYYIPFFNMRLLREFSVFFGMFFKVLFVKVNKKQSAVICDALNISGTMAALCASWLRGLKTIGIVTDVPCHRPNHEKPPFHERMNLRMMKKFDQYLLLTEQMNEVVNPKGKPYIVLEGHADLSMASIENQLSNKATPRICLYAGSLRRIYGIENLVQGFLQANIENAELHIYGDGNFVGDLKELAKKHETVKYLGVAPNSEIVQAELAATLLVNPRPTNEDYTKYSFPSKNMEYMASGTPVLTTKLPGMPKDHFPYVYFIEEETVDGIAKALNAILTQSREELLQKGKDAKEFILREKNNVSQAKKVLDMVETLF